ncbi:MAG: helix-hairpin-helix domain-containing protein, partial [Candidatus Parvarchaeota archaeon]
IVDSHEPQSIADKLRSLGYNVTIKELDVGDYVFEGGIAFERKSLDFLSYSDVITKCMELKQVYPHPFLIVEQNVNYLMKVGNKYGSVKSSIVYSQIFGAIASLALRGIPPIFVGEQSNLIYLMDRIVSKFYDGKDRENFTIENIRVAKGEDYTLGMYLNLPGVGKEIAERIIKKYPSVMDLINAKLEDLEEIEGIGKVKARNIYNTLRGIK